jgi:formylglycine-generating enzyme required for sulfatase activity
MSRFVSIAAGLETLLAQLLAQAPLSAPPDLPAPTAAICPNEMRLVEGVHYENVQRLCTDYRMAHCWAFFPGLIAREPRATPVRVCMDRYEWPNRAGSTPAIMVRFVEAEAECARAGKRLCTEFEWEMACEGPDTTPWPYGHRQDPRACNTAKPYMFVSEKKLNAGDSKVRSAEVSRVWQGEPSGSFPACVSTYGVVDLVGNVEEWVSTSRPEWPFRSSLKGGFWSKPWAGCRGTNDSHGPMFRFYQVGFRCCKDPSP